MAWAEADGQGTQQNLAEDVLQFGICGKCLADDFAVLL